MRECLRKKAIQVCDKKIAAKGQGVGLSFYAFFANKNDDPLALMEAASWWIQTHQLDHFEKAIKIKQLLGFAEGADVKSVSPDGAIDETRRTPA